MSIELEKEVDRLNSKIMMLTRDLDRKHRECAALQKQLSVLSEHVLRDEWIVDYAIWQAIHDLESRCRHYPTGLEVKVQDKANSVPVEYALKLLEMVGVEMVKNDHFPNVKIIYDRSQNPLFGKN
jgi:predicted RNase H-like nuclease (RuvC/YqgF family)